MWAFVLDLLFLIPSSAFECDLGPSDVLFVVKASHTMERDDFKNIKDFISSFTETLDIGRSEDKSRVGVVLFNNINEPEYQIKLEMYGRSKDAQTAMDQLTAIPCGYSWCKEDGTKTNKQAVEYADKLLSREGKRMKKIILLHIGRASQEDSSYYQDLVATDPRLKITEIIIDDGVFSPDDVYYNYYLSYNDPYRRYVSWMRQLYPNISIAIPPNPTGSSPYPKTVQDARILLSGSEFLCSTKRDLCNLIFTCPPCPIPGKSASNNDQESPVHKILPSDFPAINSGTSKEIGKMLPIETKLSKSEDDYEYEIVGDPPNLKINPTPLKDDSKKEHLKDKVDPFSATIKQPEYDYEDESSTTLPFLHNTEFKRRSKRSYYPELNQKQCSCELGIRTSSMTDYSVSCPGSRGLSPYRCHYQLNHRKGCSSPACSFANSPEMYSQRYYYQQPPAYTGYTNYQPVFLKQLDSTTSRIPVDHSKPRGLLTDLAKKKEENLIYRDDRNYLTKKITNEVPSLLDLFTPVPPRIHDILSKFDTLDANSNDQKILNFKSPDSGSDLTDVSLAEGVQDIQIPNGIRKRAERSLDTKSTVAVPLQSYLYRTHVILSSKSTPSLSSPIQLPTLIASNLCSVSGVDVVAYIDDTSYMSTEDFEQVKVALMNVYKMFKRNSSKCNELSRMGILKVKESGEISLVDEVMQIWSHTEYKKIISSMKYAGCYKVENNCELALPRAMITAANLLDWQASGREKILLLFTSRNQKQIASLSTMIEKPLQYCVDHKVRIITVMMNRGK